MFTSLLALIGLAFVGLGVIGAHFGIASPTAGFLASVSGLCVLTLVLLATLPRVMRDRRERPWFSFLLGVVGAGALAGLGYLYFCHPLTEITTDFANVPKLRAASLVMVDHGAEYLDPSMQVPREYDSSLAARQKAQYPTLTGPVAAATPEGLYAAFVKASAGWPGWRVVFTDEANLHVEAEVEETIFRFVDDVAIDFRAEAGGGSRTRVDIRSRRRDGLPDFGGGIGIVDTVRARLPEVAAEATKMGGARPKAVTTEGGSVPNAGEVEMPVLSVQPTAPEPGSGSEEEDIKSRIRQAPPPAIGPRPGVNRP